jgi:SPX domain protein involved in polyphosphate accumulation
MSQVHTIQQQRFELKFPIDEAITPQLRDFVSSYLELDDFGVGQPNLSYSIHSLYLDSDDLKTHQAGVNGTRNRFKLRLRYYDADPQSPVFVEIKRRANNCILKQRCAIRREAVPLLLAGQLVEPEHLVSTEPRHWVTLQRFVLRLHQIGAGPKLHNHYLREAWVSPHDNSVRVTIDRRVLVEPFFRAEAPVEMDQPVQVFPEYSLLELKFTTRFPNWFKELVRHFNLMQFSYSKYSDGVLALGEHRFHDDDQAYNWQGLAPIESTGAESPTELRAAMSNQALV